MKVGLDNTYRLDFEDHSLTLYWTPRDSYVNAWQLFNHLGEEEPSQKLHRLQDFTYIGFKKTCMYPEKAVTWKKAQQLIKKSGLSQEEKNRLTAKIQLTFYGIQTGQIKSNFNCPIEIEDSRKLQYEFWDSTRGRKVEIPLIHFNHDIFVRFIDLERTIYNQMDKLELRSGMRPTYFCSDGIRETYVPLKDAECLVKNAVSFCKGTSSLLIDGIRTKYGSLIKKFY